jgi:Fe-S cluster assembly protein SufD
VGLDASSLQGLFGDALDTRAEAFARFEQAAMPAPSTESWRYLDLDFDLIDYAPAASAGSQEAHDDLLTGLPSPEAVVIDGFASAYGSTARIIPFSEVPVPTDSDRFGAGAAAFTRDGIIIDVPRGKAISEPLVIDVRVQSSGTSSYPYVGIELDDGAEAAVVVAYRSASHIDSVMVPRIDINVGQGSHLRLLGIQNLGHETRSVSYNRVTVGRDASVKVGEIGLGGGLARLDLGVGLDGSGAEVQVTGLYFGHRQQILDYRLVITHRGANTRSNVFLKGAVEDQAQSIFAGLLKIEKDARHSSAFETNRNLVLSEDAKANSVPNLEILCNDVMCGHASSVGPLEEEHLYYLQSRGLRQRPAERLLVGGFFREIVQRLPVDGVAGPVTEVVDQRFALAQAEGRV